VSALRRQHSRSLNPACPPTTAVTRTVVLSQLLPQLLLLETAATACQQQGAACRLCCLVGLCRVGLLSSTLQQQEVNLWPLGCVVCGGLVYGLLHLYAWFSCSLPWLVCTGLQQGVCQLRSALSTVSRAGTCSCPCSGGPVTPDAPYTAHASAVCMCSPYCASVLLMLVCPAQCTLH
jgi:hypothetical protein